MPFQNWARAERRTAVVKLIRRRRLQMTARRRRVWRAHLVPQIGRELLRSVLMTLRTESTFSLFPRCSSSTVCSLGVCVATPSPHDALKTPFAVGAQESAWPLDDSLELDEPPRDPAVGCSTDAANCRCVPTTTSSLLTVSRS
jgi:hypothetical protein